MMCLTSSVKQVRMRALTFLSTSATVGVSFSLTQETKPQSARLSYLKLLSFQRLNLKIEILRLLLFLAMMLTVTGIGLKTLNAMEETVPQSRSQLLQIQMVQLQRNTTCFLLTKIQRTLCLPQLDLFTSLDQTKS